MSNNAKSEPFGSKLWQRLAPKLTVVEIFPPIEEEFAPYIHYFKGNVLNAGAGNRDIRSMIDGRLYNQDIPTGLHNANIDILSPLHRIPVKDGFFDTIICNAVLEHVENPEEVVAEFARVCRPGGALLLCIPFIQPEHCDPTDFQRYTIAGLRRLVEKHGFTVEKIEGVHSVYTSLAWVIIEWLNAKNSFHHFLLKLFFFPYLRRKIRKSRFHVHSLASAYRTLAIRRRECGDAQWVKALPAAYNNYSRPPQAYSMTTDKELCLVETFAREGYSGAGKIVDLGCWFGATSMCFARGLAANSRTRPEWVVESFDLFVWDDWMNPIGKAVGLPYTFQAGDSFFAVVKELIKPFEKAVRLHEQDLMLYQPPKEPIEFLFCDAMKTWELAAKIVESFFPLMIERNSYLVQQDFAYHHPIVATNHLIMWYLRDHFEFVHHVPGSCSVLFFCKKKVDPSQLGIFTAEFFTPDMIEAAYDYSLGCVSDDMKMSLRVAKLGFLLERGLDSEACRESEVIIAGNARPSATMLADLKTILAARRACEGAMLEKLDRLALLLQIGQ